MMAQALYVVSTFLAGSSPLIWLLTGGVFIGNFLRRKTGWGNFIAAVFVSSAVASLVHYLKN
jgi:RNA-directed DNA polymerase